MRVAREVLDDRYAQIQPTEGALRGLQAPAAKGRGDRRALPVFQRGRRVLLPLRWVREEAAGKKSGVG